MNEFVTDWVPVIHNNKYGLTPNTESENYFNIMEGICCMDGYIPFWIPDSMVRGVSPDELSYNVTWMDYAKNLIHEKICGSPDLMLKALKVTVQSNYNENSNEVFEEIQKGLTNEYGYDFKKWIK